MFVGCYTRTCDWNLLYMSCWSDAFESGWPSLKLMMLRFAWGTSERQGRACLPASITHVCLVSFLAPKRKLLDYRPWTAPAQFCRHWKWQDAGAVTYLWGLYVDVVIASANWLQKNVLWLWFSPEESLRWLLQRCLPRRRSPSSWLQGTLHWWRALLGNSRWKSLLAAMAVSRPYCCDVFRNVRLSSHGWNETATKGHHCKW